MTGLLELEDVTKSFKTVVAVDGVTLSVAEGKIFGLIGPNGAGKTTLVNVVSGYLKPNTGTLSFKGRDLAGMRPHERAELGMARTYQNLRLFEDSTVLYNVLIGRHGAFSGSLGSLLSRNAQEQQIEAARQLLEQLGLAEYEDAYVDQFPYGLRRRVEMARALAVEPSLLLLDEPTAGMTSSEADEIGELIRSVNDRGVTVLLVEHNVSLVTDVCDEIAVLDWGELIAQGPPDEVWAQERVRTAYLGSTAESSQGESAQ